MIEPSREFYETLVREVVQLDEWSGERELRERTTTMQVVERQGREMRVAGNEEGRERVCSRTRCQTRSSRRRGR